MRVELSAKKKEIIYHEKIFFGLSLVINLIFICVAIYLYNSRPATEQTEIIKFPDGKIAKKIRTITIDIRDNYGTAQIKVFQSYYTTGLLRLEGYWMNGDWEYCRVYSPNIENKLLFSINRGKGKGKVSIPDNNGKFSQENTFSTMETMNCYYRYGEPLTKQEYDRREKLQDDRVKKAFNFLKEQVKEPTYSSSQKRPSFIHHNSESTK